MKKVGVIGSSGTISKELEDLCVSLGKELGKKYIVFTGGRDGIMEAIAKGVNEVNGIIVGILPFEENGNNYNSLNIVTGLDYLSRSFIILKNVDAVISISGESGTAIEMFGSYVYKKPLILFKGTGGWTDRIQNVLIDGKYLDNRKNSEIYIADNIENILKILDEVIGG